MERPRFYEDEMGISEPERGGDVLEDPEEIKLFLESEETFLNRFRGKAGRIASGLVLMSALSAGGNWVLERRVAELRQEALQSGDWVDRIKQMEGKELLEIAEDLRYKFILEDAEAMGEIQKRNDGKEIIRKAIESGIREGELSLVLSKYDLYKDDNELADNVVKNAVKSDAEGYTLKFGKIIYEHQPEVVISQLNKIYQYSPGKIFENMQNLQGVPFITEEVIEKSARHSAQRASNLFLVNFKFIENKPYAKEVLKEGVELLQLYGNLDSLMENFGVYKSEPYAAEVLNKTIETHPGYCAKYFENYKDFPHAEEILEESLRRASKSANEIVYVFHNYYVFQDKPYAQEVLKQAAENGADLDPASVLTYGDLFLGNPYAERVIKRAAEKEPSRFLENYDTYKDNPYAKDILDRSVKNVAANWPDFIYGYLDLFEAEPYARKILESAAGKDPGSAIKNWDNYKHLDYGHAVLEMAARKAVQENPGAILFHLDSIHAQGYGPELINQALTKSLEVSPEAIIKNAVKIAELSDGEKFITQAVKSNPYKAVGWALDDKLKKMLEKSEDPAIKTLLEIDGMARIPEKKISLRISVLLEKIVNEGMSLEEAQKITGDRELLFRALLQTKLKPGHLAKFDVARELSQEALERVYSINYLHNEPDEKRFKSLGNLGSKELYALMVYGEEEIFTSSFNGIFNRLLKKLDAEKTSGDRLLDGMEYDKFRTFIKLCSGYNRLNEFLETMDAPARKRILEMFTSNIEEEPDMLSQAVTVADSFGILSDPEILKVFQSQIKKEYERVKREKNSQGTAIYGLLAGMFGEKAVINESWLKEMSKKYRLPVLTKLPLEELLNQDKSNIQQYFFYNDEDGEASFKSFLSQYKGKDGWSIEENEKYIVVRSKDGKKVEVFANKPAYEEEGVEEIAKQLGKRNIQSIVVVHRGHSYHADKTIERIPAIAKIVSLGSCGGYRNVDAVLQRAPKAHILSTKGTGTMLVNDPILKMINEEIRAGNGLNWPDLWDKAEQKLGNNPNFQNYVPPHKNLGVVFLKAYHKNQSEK